MFHALPPAPDSPGGGPGGQGKPVFSLSDVAEAACQPHQRARGPTQPPFPYKTLTMVSISAARFKEKNRCHEHPWAPPAHGFHGGSGVEVRRFRAGSGGHARADGTIKIAEGPRAFARGDRYFYWRGEHVCHTETERDRRSAPEPERPPISFLRTGGDEGCVEGRVQGRALAGSRRRGGAPPLGKTISHTIG